MDVGDIVYVAMYWRRGKVLRQTVTGTLGRGQVTVDQHPMPLAPLDVNRDVFASRADAVSAAKKLRDKAVAELEAQVARYRAMTFEDWE